MKENNIRIPRSLPIIFIDNLVMFPYLMFPIVITDEAQKQIINYALQNEKLMGLFLEKDDLIPEDPLYHYGCAVLIVRLFRNQDNSMSVLLQGVSRIKLEKITHYHPLILAEIQEINESNESSAKIKATRKITTELLEKVIAESMDFNKDLIFGLNNILQHSRVADLIAGNLAFSPDIKQELLETLPLLERYNKLNGHLAEMIKRMQVENSIRNNVQLEIDEDQKKYYLREQLEAIKKELGETDEYDHEIQKWFKRINSLNLPDHVHEAAKDELNRLSMLPSHTSEYSITRNYLEWLCNIPWKNYSPDCLALRKIERILAKDHYGLDKAKERIIEYLAVKKLKSKQKNPILCFVGPPGVGKTSMGQSIAKSMNRKFIRMSLGGIHDESEIRGHRRTYVGSMPGKIISEIKRCGFANPLFMLDEIDKVGKDFRGDPASALLEVLDPEQNHSFMDNYVNLAFDLSEVIFISTANTTEPISPALKDRMEIIEFSSYIEEEKIEIARKYIIPKELENNGLTNAHLEFADSALMEIIRYYVHEAGVRSLQRNIASIMRKIARNVVLGKDQLVVVTAKNVKKYLGIHKYSHELSGRKPEIGIVTGLAWTNYGGEILFCEALKMPGKGNMILTGSLGEVMQESAKIALSFIKANSEKLAIDSLNLDQFDIHVHLPAGAVPKDGPSAGVTLTTSIVSLLTQKKVRHDIAMTGEITLYGKVLPIGGVREKFLAAKRAGIKKVILPWENLDSYEEIPKKIKAGLEVKFVKQIDEVLKEVLI